MACSNLAVMGVTVLKIFAVPQEAPVALVDFSGGSHRQGKATTQAVAERGQIAGGILGVAPATPHIPGDSFSLTSMAVTPHGGR
jgi:hypothetical protein